MRSKIKYPIIVLLISLMITGTAFAIPLKDDNQLNMPKMVPSVPSGTNYPTDIVEVSKIIGSSITSQYSRDYVAYSWDGVTTADTTWTGDDDASYNHVLPWSFSFFGTTYSTISINTNGVIGLGADNYLSYTPYSTEVIAPLWGDLDQWNADNYIKVQHKSAPERVVIEWYTDSYSDAAGKDHFEAILYQDGSIRYDYLSLDDLPYSPDAGISNGAEYVSNVFESAMSVVYTPVTAPVTGTGATLNINSVDSSSFPNIAVYGSVVDSTGASYAGLDATNFRLDEDSFAQSPLTVSDIASGVTSTADIVFVFDDTGSMGSSINSLKATSINFANELAYSGIDYRLGLVTFKDDVTTINGGLLTSNATQFNDWIGALYASGGGDGPENSLDALGTAATYTFRPGAQKIFILITDQSAHTAGDGTTYTTRTVAGTINELQTAGASVFVVGPDMAEYNGVGSISASTGGRWYDIYADFTSIITEISSIITHQYVIEYATSNPAYDGLWRNISLDVDVDLDATFDSSSAGGYYAPDAGDLLVTVNSIDSSGFRDISTYVTVTDSSGSTIGGLGEGNFAVLENGAGMSPITVTDISSGSGASADIVFVFDDTGSMSGQITGLKSKAIEFADTLSASSVDYRLGLATFKDDVTVINGGLLTPDKALFNTWVNALYASGGGDGPENSLDALGAATNYTFRPGAQKIFILITDASAHTVGDGTTYTTRTLAGTIAELQTSGATVFVVGPDNVQYNGAGSISTATGGRWYSISSSFTDIIDEIGVFLTHQYRIDYTTPDSSCDVRNIVVTATVGTGVGSDTGSYTPPCTGSDSIEIQIDGKNCVNKPFVARIVDNYGVGMSNSTVIFNLGGAQFIQMTDADGYVAFTPTVTGDLLTVVNIAGFGTKSLSTLIVDDPTICEACTGASVAFGTTPSSGMVQITSFTADKSSYSPGETITLTMAVQNSAGEMYNLLVDSSATKSGTGTPLGFVGASSFVNAGSNSYQMRLYVPAATSAGTYMFAGGVYTDYLADGGSIVDMVDSPLSITIS